MAVVIETLDCASLVKCHIMETHVQSSVLKIVAIKAASKNPEIANIATGVTMATSVL